MTVKLAKSAVEFEHPAKKANHCGLCQHFEAPEDCAIVAGRVSREDWCDRFARRSLYRRQSRR